VKQKITNLSSTDNFFIKINTQGDWFANNVIIVNKDILNYYKQNLHKDQQGIYILNRFHSLEEKVYLQIEGPLLKVLKINKNKLLLESHEEIDASDAQLVEFHTKIYLKIPSLECWASFSRQALFDLSELLESTEETFFWNKKTIQHVPAIKWDSGYIENV